MSDEIIKEYKKGEITVVWKPKKCIHSEVCVKTLPEVYHPGEKPWITVEKASTEELKQQIDKCPSGALSYKTNTEIHEDSTKGVKVQVMKNGPLIVEGDLTIQHLNDTHQKSGKTAFCRCGHSENKPYCDGSHQKVNFKG